MVEPLLPHISFSMSYNYEEVRFMKKHLFCLILLLFFNPCWAGNSYLTVPGWENCVKNLDLKYYIDTCLPKDKPEGCSSSTWDTLTKGEYLPICPGCPPPKK